MNYKTSLAKGIKRDKTQYNPIKDDRDYFTWQQSFLAMARSHKIEEVFDPTFTPSTIEGIALFDEKKKFAYSVLDSVLLTDMGKTLVRKYQATFDAQKVWAEFVADATSSTKAQIMSSELLSWITSAKYDNTYCGTSSSTSSFVMYWLNKVLEYDKYIQNDADRFSDVTKLIMLQNPVNNIPELRQVKINAELEVAKGGNCLTFQQYVPLLLSAANAFDKVLVPNKYQQRKQAVFNTTFDLVEENEGEDTEIIVFEEDYSQPIDIDTYLCNITKRNKPVQSQKQHNSIHQTIAKERNYIPQEAWKRIPKDIQEMLMESKKSGSTSNYQRHINYVNNQEYNTAVNTDAIEEQPDTMLAFMSNQKGTTKQDYKNIIPNSKGIDKKGQVTK
jgi:hypothetical protein